MYSNIISTILLFNLILGQDDIENAAEYKISLNRATVHSGEVTSLIINVDLMKNYFSAWNDKNAYAISHVGWGMNLKARYEALSMYDQRDTNGTELRALAGNFLFSTGANEFAGRSTAGHFDIPILNTTITLDGKKVVEKGQLK